MQSPVFFWITVY